MKKVREYLKQFENKYIDSLDDFMYCEQKEIWRKFFIYYDEFYER